MIDPSREPPFVRVANADELAPGTARAVRAGRYEIALFNVGGEFFALENSCPHQGGPIADGWLEGSLVTCPWHGWCFDVRSGRMTLGDFARVMRFAVRREGDAILVSSKPIGEQE